MHLIVFLQVLINLLYITDSDMIKTKSQIDNARLYILFNLKWLADLCDFRVACRPGKKRELCNRLFLSLFFFSLSISLFFILYGKLTLLTETPTHNNLTSPPTNFPRARVRKIKIQLVAVTSQKPI